jgi:hypothetical protein
MSTLHPSTAADNPQAHTTPGTDLPSSAEPSRIRVTEPLLNTEHNTSRQPSAAIPSPPSADNVDDKTAQPTVAISTPQSDGNVQENTVEAAGVTTTAFNTNNVQDNPVEANSSPVKVEKPSPKAHKWSWNSRFRNRLSNWWLWELLSVAMSILCFVAMIILLAIGDQKGVPRFRYGLTVSQTSSRPKRLLTGPTAQRHHFDPHHGIEIGYAGCCWSCHRTAQMDLVYPRPPGTPRHTNLRRCISRPLGINHFTVLSRPTVGRSRFEL